MANEITNHLYSTLSVHPTKIETPHEREPALKMENVVLTPPSEQRFEPSPEMEKMAKELGDAARAMNRRLQFRFDETSNQVVVKVIDGNTDKVIKELPPQELQSLHKKMKEAVGFLLDEVI